MNRFRFAVMASCLATALAACDGGSSISVPGLPNGVGGPGASAGGGGVGPNGEKLGTNQQPLYCNNSQAYVGLDGRVLIEERLDLTAQTDRLRVKPYSLLQEDFNRALGMTPAFIQNQASTFNDPATRWSQEPALSGVNMYQAFKAAFQGCRATLTQTQFQTNPTLATADVECASFQRKFWNREPTAQERSSCASFAVSAENNDASPKNRWAYACAAVLSSVNFLAQ
jgi:hypothetical protein